MPTAERQRQVTPDVMDEPRVDWYGNEEVIDGMDYDEYVAFRPSRADLKPFAQPVMYWEVKHPGCAIHPYPSMAPLHSLPEGVWVCQNLAMQRAVQDHLRIEMMRDPEEFRLTPEEMQTMKARRQDTIRYCRTCSFMTCNFEMANLHERISKHVTQNEPRHPSALPE